MAMSQGGLYLDSFRPRVGYIPDAGLRCLGTHTWFAMKAGVAAGRLALAQAYRAEQFRSNTKLANNLIVGSLVIDGAIWGFAGAWGVNAPSEVVCLLIACLASVAMLATFGLQVRQQATAAYVVPMLVPVAAALAWRGDALEHSRPAGPYWYLRKLSDWLRLREAAKAGVLADEQTATALQERSDALELASKSKADLEHALERASRTSADLNTPWGKSSDRAP